MMFRGMISALVMAIAAAAAAQDQAPPPAPFPTVVTGTAHVEDGDTIDIMANGVREKIRLEGIDAPETWPWEQGCITARLTVQACGEAATRALRAKIRGDKVRCAILGRDIYSRLLGECFSGPPGDEVNLNAWMVREGYAVAYRRYSQAYVADQEAARKERKGLWATKFVMPAIWRCRVNTVGQERFDRCRSVRQ